MSKLAHSTFYNVLLGRDGFFILQMGQLHTRGAKIVDQHLMLSEAQARADEYNRLNSFPLRYQGPHIDPRTIPS